MDDGWLEELTLEECHAFLRKQIVGRVGVVVDGCPVVLPVNYRFVETSGPRWVVFRTRPGNVIDHGSMQVAFEIDRVDVPSRQGWSVLVRGTLHRIDPDAADFRERFGPGTWLGADREAWMAIDPFAISGRRLHPSAPDWAFTPRVPVSASLSSQGASPF